MHVGTYKSALFGPQNTKKSLPKYSIGDRTILEKKIHTNPKFRTVAPRTDTGFNSRKKEELQKEISKYYKIANNEVFSRINLTDLLQLIIADSQETGRLDIIPEKTQDIEEQPACDKQIKTAYPSYLLVDVRAATEYQKCHIVGAVNHEMARLARSVNWESKDLLRYRNHPEWIIILYDYCEDSAPEYASTLIHRGYENIYLLSGGLKLARDKFNFPLVIENVQTNTDQTKSSNQFKPDLYSKFNNLTCSLPSYDEILKLKNESVPLSVGEILTEQLSIILLPPLSTKGSAAEFWYSSYSSIAPSEAGTSRCSTMKSESTKTPASQIGEQRKPWK